MKDQENLTDKTYRGFVLLSLGNVVNFFLRLGILATLARIIAPEAFGIIGLAIIVIEFCKLLTELGAGAAMVQRKNLTHQHIGTALWISFGFSCVLGIIIWLFAEHIESVFYMDHLAEALSFLALLIVFNSFARSSEFVLQKKLKFGSIAIIKNLAFAVGFGIVGLPAAFAGYELKALIFAHLTNGFVMLILFLPFVYKSLMNIPQWQKFSDLFKFGRWHTWSKMLNFSAMQSEKLVIGRFIGSEALGFYGRSQNLLNIPIEFISETLGKLLFPAFTHVKEDQSKLHISFKRSYGIACIITMPLSLIIALFAENIINIVLGPNWDTSIIPLQILSAILFLRTTLRIKHSIIQAIGKEKERSFSQLIFTIFVVTGSLLFYHHGIEGIAFVLTISYCINFLLLTFLVKKYANIPVSLIIYNITSALPLLIVTFTAYLTSNYILGVFAIENHFISITAFGVVLILFLLTSLYFNTKLLLGKEGLWLKDYLSEKYLKK